MSIQPDPLLIARVLHDTLMRLQADKSIRVDLTEPLEEIRKAVRICNYHRQGSSCPPQEAAESARKDEQ